MIIMLNRMIVKRKDFNVKQHDYNVKWHEYNVKQRDYNVKRHDYNDKRNGYNVMRHEYNVMQHDYNVKCHEFNVKQHDYCSAHDWDRIRITWGNPQSGCTDICSYSKRATVGVRAPYATRRKLRYEANQVWMNTIFISQGPQLSGI
jgi:hypothetical protein